LLIRYHDIQGPTAADVAAVRAVLRVGAATKALGVSADFVSPRFEV
jgi:hypothetical protein